MPTDPRETVSLLGEAVADLVVTNERLTAMADSTVTGTITPPPPMAPYQVSGSEFVAATIADLTAKKALLLTQAYAVINSLEGELAAL
jgi:hypothetical protein